MEGVRKGVSPWNVSFFGWYRTIRWVDPFPGAGFTAVRRPRSSMEWVAGSCFPVTAWRFFPSIGQVRKNVPPLLICDGEKDPIVPGLEGRELYEKLQALGADATYWMSPGGGHAYPSGPGFDRVLDHFLIHSLKLETEP